MKKIASKAGRYKPLQEEEYIQRGASLGEVNDK